MGIGETGAMSATRVASGRVEDVRTVVDLRSRGVSRVLVHDFAGHPFQIDLSRALARRGHVVQHVYCRSYTSGKGRFDVDEGTDLRVVGSTSAVLRPYSPMRASARRPPTVALRQIAGRFRRRDRQLQRPLVAMSVAAVVPARAALDLLAQDLHSVAMTARPPSGSAASARMGASGPRAPAAAAGGRGRVDHQLPAHPEAVGIGHGRARSRTGRRSPTCHRPRDNERASQAR